MQILEFVPILIFVAVYYFSDIFAATAALMVAVGLQIGITRLMGRPISGQLKITFALTVVFGALTLAFQDKLFIQWKPTIVNWALAGALVVSQFVGRRNLIERMLGSQLQLPAKAWRTLNVGWACGFFVAGVLNLLVAYNFSESFWVNYKLIGGFAITLFYIVLTYAYLASTGYLADADKARETTP
ncbi:MAG: septation protein IspZ [Gammaproteobacteria bacterium]|nr:septation protein IspZ [Gammaproteobacteria bacterium]